jgi:hypothetical protein
MRRYPDTLYLTHLQTILPALCASHPDARAWLEHHQDVVEQLLVLDVESLRPELEAMHPVRPGGRRPFDPVVLVRSLWLGVVLAGGRWNRWAVQLRTSTVLRVLLGLDEDQQAPSVATHYRFMQRLLRHSDQKGLRTAEVDRDARGRFRRILRNEEPPSVRSTEGACADMLRLMERQGAPPPDDALDMRLVHWLTSLGVRAMGEAGVLSQALRISIDGTSQRSHARGRGHSLSNDEPETTETAEAGPPDKTATDGGTTSGRRWSASSATCMRGWRTGGGAGGTYGRSRRRCTCCTVSLRWWWSRTGAGSPGSGSRCWARRRSGQPDRQTASAA